MGLQVNWQGIFGIALLALIPAFIAQKKGRSFWVYYLFCFVVSPLVILIVVLCLRNLNNVEAREARYKDISPLVNKDVITKMNSLRLTQQQEMTGFQNDKSILEGLFSAHTTEPEFTELRDKSEDQFLIRCGEQAFGAGIWTTYKIKERDQSADQLTAADVIGITKDFDKTDPYILGLNALGLSPNSPEKKEYDNVIFAGKQSLREAIDYSFVGDCELRAFIQVMFNAGVTVAKNKDL